ncbi:MAG: transketolase [Spirochaetaceae bacterium]|nr:transketolase [Spirochaetaceae bacterium]
MNLEQRALTETDKVKKSKLLTALACRFRMEILEVLHAKQTGHWGGASSACELVTALYFHRMRIDPAHPEWDDRDRFILSKGHASMLLYTVLAHRGYFSPALLGTFRDIDSSLQGHPCMKKTPGVDMSTGALGHGISVGVGMALAARIHRKDYQTYVMVGEGCLDEGQSWEAIMSAAKFKPEGLTVLVDNNGVQLDGTSDEIMPISPLEDKFQAFGWNVLPKTYDGNNMDEILESFDALDRATSWPKVVVYRTVKGKGVSFMEGKNTWHGAPIDDTSFELAKPELEKAYKRALAEVR